ncbi:hypothetical protein Hanom_Chr10g00894321 [Helianthus anomalus]
MPTSLIFTIFLLLTYQWVVGLYSFLTSRTEKLAKKSMGHISESPKVYSDAYNLLNHSIQNNI